MASCSDSERMQLREEELSLIMPSASKAAAMALSGSPLSRIFWIMGSSRNLNRAALACLASAGAATPLIASGGAEGQ